MCSSNIVLTSNLLKVASSLVLVAWTEAAQKNLKVKTSFVIRICRPDLILSETRLDFYLHPDCRPLDDLCTYLDFNATQIVEHHEMISEI